jgi:hypothetical protein
MWATVLPRAQKICHLFQKLNSGTQLPSHTHAHTFTHTQNMLIHTPTFFLLRKASRLKIS